MAAPWTESTAASVFRLLSHILSHLVSSCVVSSHLVMFCHSLSCHTYTIEPVGAVTQTHFTVTTVNQSKVVTVLGSHLSKAASLPGPKILIALKHCNLRTSLKQPPLYKRQLELAHRWLYFTGFTVLSVVCTVCNNSSTKLYIYVCVVAQVCGLLFANH